MRLGISGFHELMGTTTAPLATCTTEPYALGNRLVGILHGCVRHHTAYNELTAWAHRQITDGA